MEKLDEIKARYLELTYRDVMSADTVSREMAEAVRLLIEQDNADLQEKCAQLERVRKELRIEVDYWRHATWSNEIRLGCIKKYYTWKKPLSLWDHIKALLTMNNEVHHM